MSVYPKATLLDNSNSYQYAAFYRKPNTCRFLLENGADANTRTSWGASSLKTKAGYVDRKFVYRSKTIKTFRLRLN